MCGDRAKSPTPAPAVRAGHLHQCPQTVLLNRQNPAGRAPALRVRIEPAPKYCAASVSSCRCRHERALQAQDLLYSLFRPSGARQSFLLRKAFRGGSRDSEALAPLPVIPAMSIQSCMLDVWRLVRRGVTEKELRSRPAVQTACCGNASGWARAAPADAPSGRHRRGSKSPSRRPAQMIRAV